MDLKSFKRILSLLESSGGRDLAHKEVTEGPQAGTTAIGEYGMMPRTIQNLARNNPQKTELDKIIESANPKMVEEILASNPEKKQQYINQLLDKVIDKSDGNALDASVRWLAGQNSSPQRIKSVAEQHPERIAKLEDILPRSEKIEPTFVEQLVNKIPPKEVLFNKIRNRLK